MYVFIININPVYLLQLQGGRSSPDHPQELRQGHWFWKDDPCSKIYHYGRVSLPLERLLSAELEVLLVWYLKLHNRETP